MPKRVNFGRENHRQHFVYATLVTEEATVGGDHTEGEKGPLAEVGKARGLELRSFAPWTGDRDGGGAPLRRVQQAGGEVRLTGVAGTLVYGMGKIVKFWEKT